jgi:cobalamin biosynthesis protein CobT
MADRVDNAARKDDQAGGQSADSQAADDETPEDSAPKEQGGGERDTNNPFSHPAASRAAKEKGKDNGSRNATGQAEAASAAQPGEAGRANIGTTQPHAPGQAHGRGSVDLDQAVGQGVMEQLAVLISEKVAAYARDTRTYRPWAREYDKVRLARDASTRTHRERVGEVMPLVTGVRQHLLQALLAEPRARWQGDREEGRINPASLHRLVQPGPGKGDNPRVFRRKVRTKRLRTAVTLLVDESYSMGKMGKSKLAADTALVFCEALSRLGVKTSVVGFTTSGIDLTAQAKRQTGLDEKELGSRYRLQPLLHTMYKRFDEPFQAVSGRMESIKPSGLTPLGESMLFAARGLAVRPEERKVLFVLTDGKPGLNFALGDMVFTYAREAIKRIERGGIDVALVGIQEDSVRELHTRAVVVRRLDDLPRQALRELRKMLAA